MPTVPSAGARLALAPRDGNREDLNSGGAPFVADAKNAAAAARAKGDAGGVKTYVRRKAKTNADAPAPATPEQLAEDLKALAVVGKPAAEDEEDEEDADSYNGPYDDDDDSDCGGPGSLLKAAKPTEANEKANPAGKTFVRRQNRLARNNAGDQQKDDAAVRTKLAEARAFFVQVDEFSLASESASPSRGCPSVAPPPPQHLQQQQEEEEEEEADARAAAAGGGEGGARAGVTWAADAADDGDAIFPVGRKGKAKGISPSAEPRMAKALAAGGSGRGPGKAGAVNQRGQHFGGGGGGVGEADEDAEDPYAPKPTTPGTKHALTREWLSAIPATFSPAMSDRIPGESPIPAGTAAAAAAADYDDDDEEEEQAETERSSSRLLRPPLSAAPAAGNHRRMTLSTLREDADAASDDGAGAGGEGEPLGRRAEEEHQPATPAAAWAAATPSGAAGPRRSSLYGAAAGGGGGERGAAAGPGTSNRRRRSSLAMARRVSTVAVIVPVGRRRSGVTPRLGDDPAAAAGNFIPGADVDFQPGGGIHDNANANAAEFHRLSLGLGRPSLGRAAGAAARLSFGGDATGRPSMSGRPSMTGRPSLAPDGAHATLVELDEEDEDDDEEGDVFIEEEFVDDEENDEEEAAEEAVAATAVETEDGVAAGALPATTADADEVKVATDDKDTASAPVDVNDVTKALASVELAAENKEDEVEEEKEEEEEEEEDTEELSPLASLLRQCGQDESDVVPMAEAVKSFTEQGVKKIGEGTYGEAFKGNGLVLKIVPMGGDALINGEPQMGPAQVRAEAAIAMRLTELRPDVQAAKAAEAARAAGAASKSPLNSTEGFINTAAVTVCRGPYAPPLLEAWTAFDRERVSENEDPAGFSEDQLYIVFACADGGVDLEHIQLNSAAEATAMLLQVTVALAVAEEEMRFEHRDLHWGNVLLRRCGAEETKTARLNGVEITYPTNGLAVNIIDFTLSRLDMGDDKRDNVAFCDLSADPELFGGPAGHCQSDTYRRMKKATRGKWEQHCPKTNALWLHYLADCLLTDKEFPATVAQKHDIKGFRKRAAGYNSAAEALWDDMFVGRFKTGVSR